MNKHAAQAVVDSAIVYRDPRTLKDDPRNSRTHSPEQIERIRASMREFGFTNPVLLRADGATIGAGHGRNRAALLDGLDRVPTITLGHLSEAQWRAYAIADNQLALESAGAGWNVEMLAGEIAELQKMNFDLGLIGFDSAAIDSLLGGFGLPSGSNQSRTTPATGSLADRFMIPPFSVLSAREGWWQNRKRLWIELGIQSELGRGENALGFSDTILEPKVSGGGGGYVAPGGGGLTRAMAEAPMGRVAAKAVGTQGWVQQKIAEGDIEGGMAAGQSGTSIFDPVLTELAYRWFCPPKGVVLDPFAGGSVRGIVAGKLGRSYYGVDLRAEQCEANRRQADRICIKCPMPQWLAADSMEVHSFSEVEADFILSCPPYGDLEVYSDDERDLSRMSAADFLESYRAIIRIAIEQLKPDRFACFVVGDYRDANGVYANFIGQTVAAFEAAGAALYNEAILVTAAGSLPIRAGKQFATSRKLGKTHQNVLVFVKGDPRKATEACGPVDISDDVFEAAIADAVAAGAASSEPVQFLHESDIGVRFGQRL